MLFQPIELFDLNLVPNNFCLARDLHLDRWALNSDEFFDNLIKFHLLNTSLLLLQSIERGKN